ncbi:hypothetical protein LRD18_02550 [Halorhodospira halochloris]|uniref:hypothetical protein n=1 Tax=Halorhodospira halochloris TaxID=1052 RepID=UPI001EE90E92|nr:hypothetical protein [Halorhodospira halochloris]MCG5529755.1 hypothetical protein [Halorhodospira halochloris]
MLRGIKLTGLLLALVWLGSYLAWQQGHITDPQLEPLAVELERHLGSEALYLAPQIAEWGAMLSALLLAIWLLARLGWGLVSIIRRRTAANQALQHARTEQTVSAYDKVISIADQGIIKPRKALRLATDERGRLLSSYAEELSLFCTLLSQSPAGSAGTANGHEASRIKCLEMLCKSLQESLQNNIDADAQEIELLEPIRVESEIQWRLGTPPNAQLMASNLEAEAQRLGDEADKVLEKALGHDFDWRNLVEPEQVRELERPKQPLYHSAQQLPTTIQTALENLTEPQRPRQRKGPEIDWQEVREALSQRIKVDFIRRSFADRGWYAKSYANLHKHAVEMVRFAANQLWPREQELFKKTDTTTKTPALGGLFILPVPAFAGFRFWGEKRNEATIEPVLEVLEAEGIGSQANTSLATLELSPDPIKSKSPEEFFEHAFVLLLTKPFRELTAELRLSLDSYKHKLAQQAPEPAHSTANTAAATAQLTPERVAALDKRIAEMEKEFSNLDPAQLSQRLGISSTTPSSNKSAGNDIYTAAKGKAEPKTQAIEPVTVSLPGLMAEQKQRG